MQIIKKILITFACATFFLCYLGVPQAFAVNIKNLHTLTTGSDTVTGEFMGQFGAKRYEDSQSIILFVGNIIDVVLGLLGVLMIGLVIYSGFLWMSAAGEGEQIKSAQGHLTNAIIGAIIIVSAWTITAFVINSLGTAATMERESASPASTGGAIDQEFNSSFDTSGLNDDLGTPLQICEKKCDKELDINTCKERCNIDTQNKETLRVSCIALDKAYDKVKADGSSYTYERFIGKNCAKDLFWKSDAPDSAPAPAAPDSAPAPAAAPASAPAAPVKDCFKECIPKCASTKDPETLTKGECDKCMTDCTARP